MVDPLVSIAQLLEPRRHFGHMGDLLRVRAGSEGGTPTRYLHADFWLAITALRVMAFRLDLAGSLDRRRRRRARGGVPAARPAFGVLGDTRVARRPCRWSFSPAGPTLPARTGRLLIGADVRTGLPRPDRSELVVAGAEFALDALAEHVIDDAPRPESLLAAGIRWTTKIVLFPVRFLFTAETGHENTNHAAVTHYLAQHDAPAAALVSAALDWRTDPPDRDHALALLRADLLPLYRHYLDDHIERLTAAGRPELAEAFLRWRTGLEDRAASAIHPRGHTRT